MPRLMTAAMAVAALGVFIAPAKAAEREQVRAVINLIASLKMPYPERYERNTARTEYIRLGERGETVACLRTDDEWRWCYDHIPAQGGRVEMLRIRREPVTGIRVGQSFHFVTDYDLDGLVDVGSTTQMEPPAHAPMARITQFYLRGANRGDQHRDDFQRLFDDGVAIAINQLGE